ncbi:MAG: hydrogenase formation protein HypD, partial [Chloroflexi bacterium]|nr:hydrogenase formation protein HypD [Chloroflexota bacterium]
MKYAEEFRDPLAARRLIDEIRQSPSRPVTIIEFCGGHTHAIMRYGLRSALAPAVRLLSGPGCPVCVTADTDIDTAIWLAQQPGVVLATFGDMLHVPGTLSSLQQERANGARVEMVYSALDALEMARQHPRDTIVMLGIGFETTAPTIAAAIKQAQHENLANFTVLSLHKLTPPPMRTILESQVHVDAVLGPGHVSTVIGWQAWEFMPREYGVSCATAGFEPLDILLALRSLVEAVRDGRPRVINSYRRGVEAQGNKVALAMMNKVFTTAAAEWRGLGILPESGMAIRPEFAQFDARARFDTSTAVLPERKERGCRCGEVLAALIEPPQCPLFDK